MDPLTTDLRRIRRRLLAVRALEAGMAGAVAGAALAVLITVLRILVPQALPTVAAWPILAVAAIPLGFIVSFLGRLAAGVSLPAAARAADRAAGLKECLATACEVLAAGGRGLLDGQLLAEARSVSARLDVPGLPLATTLIGRSRIALIGVLVITAAAFLPSVGGPVLPPRAAAQAAAALEPLATSTSIAPAIRQKIEQAIREFSASDVRTGPADDATRRIFKMTVQMDAARRDVAKTLAASDNPELQRMARAAAQGDARAASGAAAGLSEKLGAKPGAGGMPPDQREHVAASLTGAAAAASGGNLDDLAARLRDAADAVRRSAAGVSAGTPDAAAEKPLSDLARAMTQALGPEAAAGVATIVSAVNQARRDADLPPLAPPPTVADAGPAALPPAASPTASAASPGATGVLPASAAGPLVTATGTASAPAFTASPDIRPEDRDVVRRYFGG